MKTEFYKIYNHYFNLFPQNGQSLIGLLLLQSDEGEVHIKSILRYHSLCGTNKYVGSKWTKALYYEAPYSEYMGKMFGHQVPFEKWVIKPPSCGCHCYKEFENFENFDFQRLSESDFSRGHSGNILQAAN